MRRLLTWLAVSLGIAALVRRLRRRDRAKQEPAGTTAADPADELRRKLAETRSEEEPGAAPEEPEASVEQRRASVHEEGRSTIDEMRRPDDD
jgi:hypothetical protein